MIYVMRCDDDRGRVARESRPGMAATGSSDELVASGPPPYLGPTWVLLAAAWQPEGVDHVFTGVAQLGALGHDDWYT